ncbi:Cyclopropane-fatty-acyl-phospholipid [Rhodovulum sp. PH10]|nr:Cyclopropane-fatty-acyl-phospholipid [Rhodovulum sp. PH10]
MLSAARERGIELLDPAIERIASGQLNRFNTIVAFDVFEHFSISEILNRLEAAAKMLKPGGHLLLRFPNGQSPFGLQAQHGDPTHKSALSRSIFEQLIQGMPFTIVRYRAAHAICGGGIAKNIVRGLRARIRDAISRALNAIYATDIPWDPVVVLVLRRDE